jgi:hypothetical protein
MSTAVDVLTVLSPAPERARETRLGAPRVSSFEGLTVGLLDNNKPGAGAILARIAERLRERGATEVVSWRKALPSGPSPYVTDAARAADVVISGVGDCGSCSSWSLRDAFEVELMGTPTVTLVSKPFDALVHLEADSLGVPELPIFTVAHPVATRTDDELRAEADELLDGVVRALVVA